MLKHKIRISEETEKRVKIQIIEEFRRASGKTFELHQFSNHQGHLPTQFLANPLHSFKLN